MLDFDQVESSGYEQTLSSSNSIPSLESILNHPTNLIPDIT